MDEEVLKTAKRAVFAVPVDVRTIPDNAKRRREHIILISYDIEMMAISKY
jgi:hypothetical protein